MNIAQDGSEAERALLTRLLHDLHADLASSEMELMLAPSGAEFAAAIRRTADKLAEASAGWAAMSNTVCHSVKQA
jgi:hypothetical protein